MPKGNSWIFGVTFEFWPLDFSGVRFYSNRRFLFLVWLRDLIHTSPTLIFLSSPPPPLGVVTIKCPNIFVYNYSFEVFLVCCLSSGSSDAKFAWEIPRNSSQKSQSRLTMKRPTRRQKQAARKRKKTRTRNWNSESDLNCGSRLYMLE